MMSWRVAVSPDADDLFMVRAVLLGFVPADPPWAIETAGTDALNQLAASDAPPELCAISAAFWPRVAHKYKVLRPGGSYGDGVGPVVAAHRPIDLARARIAIPGDTTTAALVLKLAVPTARTTVVPIVPYARVFDALESGEVDAAVLIHEGRLTFADRGLVNLLDLGAWWTQATGTPLPLGITAVRRDVDAGRANATLTQSIEHAMEHREEAIVWLLERGTPLATPERVDAYLQLYANERSITPGTDGEEGFDRLLLEGTRAGLLPDVGPVAWA